MMNISSDISGKIDGHTVAALAHINAAAERLGIPFFIIGAVARDIFLKHLFGLPPHRATLDLDLGVSVGTWEDFAAFKAELVGDHGFKSTGQVQRLLLRKTKVDIVPFGPIAGPVQTIRWPPDESFQMSTAGFEEAFRSSHPIKVTSSPEVIVRVCSLPGLVVMKLISWHERYPERRRDAGDIFEVMEKYESAGNLDRLYSEESDALSDEAFDVRRAAIRLLGRDMARIAGPEARRRISEVLAEETQEGSKLRLVIDIAQETGPLGKDLQEVRALVTKLRQGFEEAVLQLV